MADFMTGSLEGVNVTSVYSVNTTTNPEIPGPPFLVGTIGKTTNNGEYVFCSNTTTAALVAGDVVQISSGFAATELTTTNAKMGQWVGVVPAAVSQSTSTTTYYFWAQRSGLSSARVAASVAVNVPLYSSAVAGVLTGTGATALKRVVGIATYATGGATAAAKSAYLNYPTISITGTVV